ncbi:autotransporter outer membrane beta-barrel domain-containing protein [Candidatus Avelusimicrobium fimicolum]|uniref:autotransporter outer membrane beta-barrel domain-containing protein n=1 Tax=Candidatus Avelusimicrobium fimicolum TaxID=3416216 RepID=UPI003D0D31A1
MSKRYSPQEENIYSSACIQALEQEYCSSCSAAVVSSCIVSRGFGERLVSRIYNGGRRAVYTAAVAAMLANNTALPAYGAGTYVSAGKTVTEATITSGNSQIIYSAGVADSTTIYGGLQVVSSGGVATNTTMYQDGWQFVSSGGVASNTTINPGGQRVSSGGVANTTIINSGGAQHLQSGGVANATTINSRGWQNVEGGGLANGTTINSLGWLNVASGGVASNTTINSGGYLGVSSGGVANETTIHSGGSQNVYSGGVVRDTTIHDGGLQFVYFGGKTYNVRQHSGGKMFVIVSGGDAETYVEGTNASGEPFSLQSGRASNFILYSGGSQHVKSGGVASATTIHGGAQYVSAGVASATTIHGGAQYVSAGGVASATTIHGGTQYVSAGGTALETTIHGGTQDVSAGGVASNTTINEGGLQNVSSGGKAYNVMQYSGGNINADVYGGDTSTYVSGTNASREAFTLQNGVASNFILYAGGLQNVFSGGVASATTIQEGGLQNVSSRAVVSDTLVAGGVQNVYSSGVASNTTLNSGAVNLYEGGLISGLNATGGDLNVYGNNTLQGNINLADAQVNINHTTGMNTLGIENLSANNAVFNMNVDLETQTADKLNITDSYSGNANLKLTNVAPTAQATTGDGIKLVEFADTATVNGTFDLLGGKWDEGGYVYKLAQGTAAGTGQDYYLRNTQELTDTFKTMLNVPIMNIVIAQTGMNSLQKRLGDLRAMDNTQAKQGVWVRSYYKDMTVDDLIKTDANLFGAEAGYDWLFRAEEPTKLYAGVLVGFVSTRNIKTKKSDGVYDKGDGEAPGVGVYATLLNENGWFVDLAARNFWSKLDMKNHSSTGTELAYKPNRNVVAASVEVGKSINSELARNKFIRIEPKLEIGYMHASAENASVGDTGNDIRYNAANYVNAKAGVLLAYNAVRDNGLLIEPLLELAYRYEFAGKDDLAYAGAAEKSDLSGGTLEVNAGLDMQLTKNLYWYGLGSYEAGNIVKGWGVHAGIRYAFGGTQDSSAAQTPANAAQKGQVVKKAGEPQKKNGKETDSPNKALKEGAGGRSPASQK